MCPGSGSRFQPPGLSSLTIGSAKHWHKGATFSPSDFIPLNKKKEDKNKDKSVWAGIECELPQSCAMCTYISLDVLIWPNVCSVYCDKNDFRCVCVGVRGCFFLGEAVILLLLFEAEQMWICICRGPRLRRRLGTGFVRSAWKVHI